MAVLPSRLRPRGSDADYSPLRASDPVNQYSGSREESSTTKYSAAGRVRGFAVKGIRAGTEILIDYSTTIGDDDIWTMRYRCGSRLWNLVRQRAVRAAAHGHVVGNRIASHRRLYAFRGVAE